MLSNLLCARRSLATALITLAAPWVIAQTPKPPEPTPLSFDSVFIRYKPLGSLDIGSWRDANDTVTRIGGWRTYLKDTQQTLEAEKAKPGNSSAPAKPVTAAQTPPSAAPAPNVPSGQSHGAHPHGSPR